MEYVYTTLFFSLSVKYTDNPFNCWTAVLQEALITCFYSGELLCLLCFPQSVIMHIQCDQEKPTGMRYMEGPGSLSGFRCDTPAEPLSPVRASPKCVILSRVRKCRVLHTVDTTVITRVMNGKVFYFKYMTYGRFHFDLWYRYSQGKQSLHHCVKVVSVLWIVSDSNASTLAPFTIVFSRKKYEIQLHFLKLLLALYFPDFHCKCL